MDTDGLLDLGFKGSSFTWNNRRVGKANIQERIDRGFINGSWRLLFLQVFVTHLLALNSDHRPLLLHTTPNQDSGPKPFKFESMWTRDPTTADVIANVWRC